MKKLMILVACMAMIGATPKKSDTRMIMNEMFRAINSINEVEFKMKMKERIGTKMVKSEIDAKVNVDPLQVYIYSVEPNNGVEILYLEGENNGKAVVNPNGFPFVNLAFSPFSPAMRKNKHHTILSMGFGMLGNLLEDAYRSSGDAVESVFRYQGEVNWNGRQCYKITLEDDNFQYVPYSMEQRETLHNLAKRKNISEHLIREANGISGFGKLIKGKEIVIPTSYAKTTELYICKETFLPYVQIMSDEKGVFEYYEYHNVKINPDFDENTFSKSNKAYGF